MLQKLFAVLGVAPKKPLFCKKWLSFERDGFPSQNLIHKEIGSVLTTGDAVLTADSPMALALQDYIGTGKGFVLVDSTELPLLPLLTAIVQRHDRDADVEVFSADEDGLYAPGIGQARAESKIIVINPPSYSSGTAPLRERTLSNLLVELLYDTSLPGHHTDTLVLFNGISYGMRESLLCSVTKPSQGMSFQSILHIPNLKGTYKSSPKFIQHITSSVDVCVSSKRHRRLFTTQREAAAPMQAANIRIEM